MPRSQRLWHTIRDFETQPRFANGLSVGVWEKNDSDCYHAEELESYDLQNSGRSWEKHVEVSF